jgi:hypothetical protein
MSETGAAHENIRADRAHQVSPKGRASSSKDQADRGCRVSATSVAAMSSGFTKKSAGLSLSLVRISGSSMMPSSSTGKRRSSTSPVPRCDSTSPTWRWNARASPSMCRPPLPPQQPPAPRPRHKRASPPRDVMFGSGHPRAADAPRATSAASGHHSPSCYPGGHGRSTLDCCRSRNAW